MTKKHKNSFESGIKPKHETMQAIMNGLESALGFSPDTLLNQYQQGFGVQLSQLDTLSKNLRGYFASNFRQLLSQMYVEHGLIKTLIDVPVDDAFRGGIEIKSEQLDEGELKELRSSMDRDNDIGTLKQALKWNRLFGGAGVLMMTDQDPETPFDMKALDRDAPFEFRACDMWELFWDKQTTEGYDPEIQTQNFEFYNYYAKKIHKSRVMRLKGLIAPSFLRPRLRGWGFSVVEQLVRPLNQYLKQKDLTFEVLDEFKLDIFKIKNLTDTLQSPMGEQQVQQRIRLANKHKNYQNAIVMDGEDDYDHKQLSFAGLAEVQQGNNIDMACNLRMPLTKIFGMSAAGFNAGEEDIENYNAMVEGTVREPAKYDAIRMVEIKCQKLFGFVPDDLEISFKPLRVLGAEQEETVKTQKFQRLLAAKQANELTTFEFREACNKGNLFDIKLDTTLDKINTEDPQISDLLTDPYETTDVNDPGANRSDTRTPRAWDTKTTERKESPEHPHMLKTFKEEPVDKIKNSIDFEIAQYRADGGESWIDPARLKGLMELSRITNGPHWEKAKEVSRAAFGEIRWPFVMWYYKKHGGKL
jgi:uncharacterized protein